MSSDNRASTPAPDNSRHIAGVFKTKGLMYEWELSVKYDGSSYNVNSPVFSFPLKQDDVIEVITFQLLLTDNGDEILCNLKLISCDGLESVTLRCTLSSTHTKDKTEQITFSSNMIWGKGIHIYFENELIKCYIEIVGVNPIKTKPSPAQVDFDLMRDFTTALATPEFSDCTLCIGDQEIKVHKFILAARSPVFATMFRQDMKESKTGTVEIVDLEFEVIEEMVKFMYTGTSPRNETMADRLLQAADKYRIEGLVKMCGVTLANNLSVKNAVNTLILGDRYSVQDLNMAAVRFIISNLRDVKKTNEWHLLFDEPRDIIAELFCRLDQVTMVPSVSA